LGDKTPNDSPSKTGSKQYMKYAGLATTMFFTLFLMYWLGSKLDEYVGNEVSYFGLAFMVLSLFAYLYKIVKALS